MAFNHGTELESFEREKKTERKQKKCKHHIFVKIILVSLLGSIYCFNKIIFVLKIVLPNLDMNQVVIAK